MSRLVAREDLDEFRTELRAMGCTTWITGAFVLRVD